MGPSILARIERAADPASSERTTFRADELEKAVLANLALMLNTRQGSVPTCPDYGIIELSEMVHDLPDAIGLMQRAIKNTIQTYEPRLKNVQVRHVKTDTSLSLLLEYEITAQLTFPDGRKHAVRFGSTVDGSGHVRMTT